VPDNGSGALGFRATEARSRSQLLVAPPALPGRWRSHPSTKLVGAGWNRLSPRDLVARDPRWPRTAHRNRSS
jgi:hypothetical protein